jgi:hypothetical protein
MSKWQPARFIRVHERPPSFYSIVGEDETTPKANEMHGKLIFVREPGHPELELFRMMGCDATKFYSVRGFPHKAVCEHEILTD